MSLREAQALFAQYRGKKLTSYDLRRLRQAAIVIRAARKRNPRIIEPKIVTLPDGRKFPAYKGEVLSRVPGSVWTLKDEQEGSPRLKRVLSTMTRAELEREYREALRGSFDRVFKAGKRYFEIVKAEVKRRGLKSNPRRAVQGGRKMIYGQLLRIEAKKSQPHLCDADCVKHSHCYYHDFGPGAVIYGLPDGSLRIVHREGKRLWKMFH